MLTGYALVKSHIFRTLKCKEEGELGGGWDPSVHGIHNLN